MLSSLAILNMNGVEINVDTLLFGNDFLKWLKENRQAL
jgi:hypothetical protein